MSETRTPLPILIAVIWLTRIGGFVFALSGLWFLVLAWQAGSLGPLAMGVGTLAFGIFCMSARRTQEGGFEYALLRKAR